MQNRGTNLAYVHYSWAFGLAVVCSPDEMTSRGGAQRGMGGLPQMDRVAVHDTFVMRPRQRVTVSSRYQAKIGNIRVC